MVIDVASLIGMHRGAPGSGDLAIAGISGGSMGFGYVALAWVTTRYVPKGQSNSIRSTLYMSAKFRYGSALPEQWQ